MSVPVKKQTKSRGKKRRDANNKNLRVNTSKCPKCSSPVLSHHACAVCGTYRNREVTKSHLDKKEMKRIEKDKLRQSGDDR